MPLVVECEWGWKRKGERKKKGHEKDRYGSVKYDFQKLLVANAHLRLMIYRVADDSQVSALDDYFTFEIENYKHLSDGSKFLFIVFNENIEALHYATHQRRTAGCDYHREAK